MADGSDTDDVDEILDPDLDLDDDDDGDPPCSLLIDGYWEFSDRPELCPEGGEEALYRPPKQKNHYLQFLKNSRELLLHNPTTVLSSWRKLGPLGLFLLFITPSLLSSMLVWTNTVMESKGLPPVTMDEFKAFIGLEMGGSMIAFNSIKDYWSGKEFKGSAVYKETLPRTRFEQIRSNFQIHPPSDNSTDNFDDPLSFCRFLLSSFQKRCFKVATPRGACAGDEASQGCAGRTRGTSFNKDKPDKHAFRFYCYNSHSPNYVNSIFDNNAGNLSHYSPLDRYLFVIPELRKMFSKYYGEWKTKPLEIDDPYVPRRSASALWAAQIVQQSLRDPEGQRSYFTDSYYTRHLLAKIVYKLSGGKTTLTGTVKYGYVDAANKSCLNPALARIQGMAKGSWILVPAIDIIQPSEWYQQNKNKRRRKGSPPARPYNKKTYVLRRQKLGSRTVHKIFVGTGKSREEVQCVVSERAGYVVLMDSVPVVFYTNDFATDVPCSPGETIVFDAGDPSSTVARTVLICVRNLATIRRWTDDSYAHRCSLLVPALIVAYNTFMNAVDIMDQFRASMKTSRRDIRMSTSLFGFFMDLATHNAYGVFMALVKLSSNDVEVIPFREFKRLVCSGLITVQKEKTIRRQNAAGIRTPGSADSVSMTSASLGSMGKDGRVLLSCAIMENEKYGPEGKKNSGRVKRVACRLCVEKFRKDNGHGPNDKEMYKFKSDHSCLGCQSGFHPWCFYAWHNTREIGMWNRPLCNELRAIRSKFESRQLLAGRRSNKRKGAFLQDPRTNMKLPAWTSSVTVEPSVKVPEQWANSTENNANQLQDAHQEYDDIDLEAARRELFDTALLDTDEEEQEFHEV